MDMYEPGRAYSLAPDPNGTHYVISEGLEFELRILFEAMRATAKLCDELSRHVSDFCAADAGPILHVFAERGADLMAQAAVHFPEKMAA